MVTLEQVRLSNAQLKAFPPGLVAMFAGATSGIGEATLKQFAKHTVKPRIYFLGRSASSGERIKTELQQLNPEGEYIFFAVDVSLLRSVDAVCRKIKKKEAFINLLFLSTGTLATGEDTPELLPPTTAVSHYARLRLTLNLLPLLRRTPATTPRRVVSVLSATREGALDTSDLPARHVHPLTTRGVGHLSMLMTLALEGVAAGAPDVSFVHCYPGAVKTNIGGDVKGWGMAVLRAVYHAVGWVLGSWVFVSLGETGERHLFVATSGRFPSRRGGGGDGVPLVDGVAVARGVDGQAGSGVYSVDQVGESAPPKVEELLQRLRMDGTAEKVWAHFEGEFVRITGTVSV